ncbi:cytochrome c3 family protein [Coriobacteriia bacterium Es71-Z0120]|uniref:cytochrome c3 family protein n=1 Tax=Parvivirga hydrogeniphila TaxID=2939460 RepID=UPI002260BB20|nr:cytochrome c3 family protein [Parvivirga hydrogeniphila]MCL4079471.1 cytochrome c3 family protein [Parvivirga hydrogeniphila]
MHGDQRIPRAALMTLAAALAISLAAPALAATPTQPVLRDVFVTPRASLVTSPTVTVQWSASTDASGHALVYDVYRDVIPITGATIISRGLTPVASGLTGTSAQINAASAETTQSYVWFYAVVARDSLGTKSAPSFNMAPNMHGNRSDPNQISCPRCHRVHGAYRVDYHLKEACYYCHGSTGANFATGAKSTYNTEASFFDTCTATAGSKHRNTYMTSTKQECTACHTPHRSPFFYDAAGVYQASQSYRRMLRIEYATNTYEYYSRNDNPGGNAFCFSCHGSTAVTWNGKTINAQQAMSIAGGTSAYANAGGDHNYAGYASAAHGPSTVLTNTTEPNPGIQCLACHNKHASRADKLVDYRSQNTTASQTGGADICFACHSATSTDTRIAGSAAPFSWNGRDVKAQFTNSATYISRHPYRIVAGSWVTDTMTVLSHTTKSEFDTYSLVNAATTDSAGGEIQLAQYTTSIQVPVVFGMSGGSTTFDEYTPSANAWNTLYNPASSTLGWSPGSGSSAFVVNNRVYITRGGSNTTQGYYDISSNSWSAGQALPNSIGQGGDTAVNPRSDSTCVYYTRANGQSAIMWWNYTGTGTGSFNFQTGGSARTLGIGSAIAFAPVANRLFVIYQSGTNGDGRLYYRSSPGRSTTSVDFTQGVQVTSDVNTRYARMTYFTKNGTEYLMIVGRDTGDNRDTIIVSNLAGTPTITNLNIDPFGADLGDGCDLEWDGGDYIYAIRGGGQAGFARILIPDDPASAASWDAWQSLANPPWGSNWNTGSSIAPAAYTTTGLAYRTSGTATTPDITPDASVHHWGTVSWTEDEPVGTGLRVSVLGYNGSSWTTIAASVDDSPISLAAYATSAYPRIRLVAELSTSDNQKTPTLYDWTVTGLYDRYVTATGSLTCANCHNVHYVGKGTAGTAWSMARASDPDNTKLAAPSSPTDFCLRCHDGAAAPATTTATSIVPYSAAFRDVTAPFFPGWNKAASGVDFASSGHKETTIQKLTGQFGCQTCHDPHASQNQRLTAITQIPDGSTSTGHLNVSRDNSTTWSEQALCYGCHDGRRSGTCSSTGCHNTDMSWLNVSGAFGQTYRHPVERSGRHTDTETASQLGASNRHAECVDCHDPHVARRGRHTTGSSLAGEVLRGATGVKPTAWPSNWTAVPSGNWTTERLNGETSDYEAYLCLKCHSSYSGQPFTATRSNNAIYTSTDQALEFNPSNFSYHNVLGQSTGMQSSFTFVDSGGTTRNVTWAVPTVSFFVSGSSWTVNSMMTCTECHTNSTASAKGPHGSSVEWLLDPNYTTDWKTAYLSNTTNGMSSTTIICAKCHDLNGPSGTWSNNVHSTGDHQGNFTDGGCVKCHIKIPHGWKRPRLLVRVTADGTYAGSSSGLTAVGISNITLSGGQAQWSKNNCSTNCGEHGSISPYWP